MEDNDKKKKSILTEAYIDYNEIMEAADLNAKNKLAKEFPEKFNQFLNEEKIKNKIAKESDKDDAKKNKESNKLDKTNLNDESDMKNQGKETVKVANKNVNRTKKTLKEEFESNEHNSDFEEEGLNEFLTLDEIETELDKFSNPEEDGEESSNPEEDGEESFNPEEDGEESLDLPAGEEGEENDEEDETSEEETLEKLVQLRDELNSVISGLGGGEEGEDEFNFDDDQTGEETEDNFDIPDDEEINELLNQDSENEIEEAHGLSYSARRNNTGRHTPHADHLSKAEVDQSPMQMQESNKKIKSLINENKELTKKVNNYKAKTTEINETVNKFKEAIGKYRKQLTEMAVFNTNIAHVNNILVNESLALTQEDKLRVINEFKSIGSITESQIKYKSILSEMTSNKKNITESVKEKLNTVIETSSKHKLDEVIEKTAYKNNEHINKIKKMIEYVERKNK